jgi:hypothetical protein
MTPARWVATVATLSVIACASWPLSPALSSRDAIVARLVCAAVTVVASAAIGLARGGRTLLWRSIAGVSAALALTTLLFHFSASAACVADYNGVPTLVGRSYTMLGLEHVRANPGSSNATLLLDAGGDPTLIWTSESILSCRFWLSWGALLAVPLFAICVNSLIAHRRFRLFAAPARGVAGPRVSVGAPVYDGFLSYRHADSDAALARELLETLESHGLRVAIDIRDFAPNEHFLTEMERCIKESRFVLCVITPRYVDSEYCVEEAIISKTLDMADRRKRLVPLIFERVELPVWLHGLVGIDFTAHDGIDPAERLLALLKKPVNPQV